MILPGRAIVALIHRQQPEIAQIQGLPRRISQLAMERQRPFEIVLGRAIVALSQRHHPEIAQLVGLPRRISQLAMERQRPFEIVLGRAIVALIHRHRPEIAQSGQGELVPELEGGLRVGQQRP